METADKTNIRAPEILKDFRWLMMLHQKMLGLGNEDVRILKILRDKGL